MRTTIDVALPVLNEDQSLESNVRCLVDKLSSGFPYAWTVSIVDNGSTDESWAVASRMARTVPNVRALRLEQRGRGGALKAAWTTSDADVLAYMDIDLSTDLSALGPLLDPVAEGSADIVIGCRLDRKSRVTRSTRREIISHLYNWIARALLRYRVRDAQCGFKAINRCVVETIVPKVSDDSWFFDTELLVIASRARLRIKEIPVTWVEDDDSRVKIVSTAMDDLRGIVRLMRRHDPVESPSDNDHGAGERVVEIVQSSAEHPAACRSSTERITDR